MEIDLQEKFKNLLQEDIKFYLDTWHKTLYSPETYPNMYREQEQKLLDEIIELRWKFAKEISSKTATQACPKPQ
ncbi:hypothetical protein Q7M94_05455 (plasmid) [Candidatus Liberibacter asiaticus]|uniref:hypothetical protein n=1 Tax=Liberibacter asiaticus TaxID=34021 RepID=UPI0023490B13|nr:hypothetical protein [Candidatus Liberibacter asiaticus]WCM58437.1 hypothetical protein NLY32_05440 [Candidatus Liberibacter asiaticus]